MSVDETACHLLDTIAFHFVLHPIEFEKWVDSSSNQEETVVVEMTKAAKKYK